MPLKSPVYHKIYRATAVLGTLAAVAANGLYVRYFSFSSALLRTIYLAFVVLHPLTVIVANCYISGIFSGMQRH